MLDKFLKKYSSGKILNNTKQLQVNAHDSQITANELLPPDEPTRQRLDRETHFNAVIVYRPPPKVESSIP